MAGGEPGAQCPAEAHELNRWDPQAVWYTQGRGHVGSVLGGLASWDGIGILFDSSAKDSWVSARLWPTFPPTPSSSSLCPRLRLLITFNAEQACHPCAGQ